MLPFSFVSLRFYFLFDPNFELDQDFERRIMKEKIFGFNLDLSGIDQTDSSFTPQIEVKWADDCTLDQHICHEVNYSMFLSSYEF